MNTKLCFLMVLTVLASACGKDDDKKAAPVPGTESRTIQIIAPFDINNIPVTDKDIGEFPFFMPPEGYRYVTITKNTLDESISLQEPARTIYPLGKDRIRMVEGKTLRVSLYSELMKEVTERDFLLIQRHYEDAITAAGGVQVFGEEVEIGEAHGTLAPEENQLLPHSIRSPMRVYVIHKPDAEIWLEINCGGGAGCLFTVTRKGKI